MRSPLPWRRTAAALLAAMLGSCSSEPPASRPSVVLISLDCLNQRQLEQAWTKGRAPELARLAGDSLVFTRAYAHAPWTTPSHMSMLTGLYPSQHGRDIPFQMQAKFQEGYDREPLFQTLPERLAASGFETVAFVGGGQMAPGFGLAQGFSTYHSGTRANDEKSDIPGSRQGLAAWLEGRRPGPFFLFLHTYELHYPLARPPFLRSLDNVDRYLGEVLTALRERDLYDSSLVILTGDHGSRMIRTRGKCCVHGAGHYDENLRVPLLLKLPSRERVGRVGDLARHVDLLPTVLDVVGLPLGPYEGPGVSLRGSSGGPAGGAASFSYSEADGRCWSRRAVVEKRYKYIYTPRDPWSRLLRESPSFFDGLCQQHAPCLEVPSEELYDLDADPFERANLLEAPLADEAREALGRLRGHLSAQLNLPPAYRRRLPLPGESPGPLGPEQAEALRTLGYLE